MKCPKNRTNNRLRPPQNQSTRFPKIGLGPTCQLETKQKRNLRAAPVRLDAGTCISDDGDSAKQEKSQNDRYTTSLVDLQLKKKWNKNWQCIFLYFRKSIHLTSYTSQNVTETRRIVSLSECKKVHVIKLLYYCIAVYLIRYSDTAYYCLCYQLLFFHENWVRTKIYMVEYIWKA